MADSEASIERLNHNCGANLDPSLLGLFFAQVALHEALDESSVAIFKVLLLHLDKLLLCQVVPHSLLDCDCISVSYHFQASGELLIFYED